MFKTSNLMAISLGAALSLFALSSYADVCDYVYTQQKQTIQAKYDACMAAITSPVNLVKTGMDQAACYATKQTELDSASQELNVCKAALARKW